jgi:peptidyl-prolyl cis-trans isomerase A (cyclophilin A)
LNHKPRESETARWEKRQMNTRIYKAIAGLVLIAFATAVSGQGSSTAQKTQTAPKPPAASSPYDKALLTPSALVARAPEEFDVKFTTADGEFVVHVTRAWAPRGADRFYNLVKHRFFDGVSFNRVMHRPSYQSDFMAQFGLSPYPDVNRALGNANIKDDPVTQSNTRGRLTFATAGPNTRSTQLFISFGNNSFLDSQGFAPIGEVTSGMDVVDKIYSGYVERPDPDQISAHGKAYIDANFPKLTIIQSARVLPAAPAAKPASQQ